MSDQVRNPEDQFSYNDAHVGPVYVDGVSADMLIYHKVTIEDNNICFSILPSINRQFKVLKEKEC